MTKLVNDDIKAKKVRLVGEGFDGSIVSLSEALDKAAELDLDLVQMSEGATDGVVTCKIMNYSKFLYAQEKRAKANKKVKQETKEIRLSDTIADNDLKTKAKQADKILRDGNKVQITIPYKGRQMAYINHGKEVMKHFQEFLTCEYKIIKPVKIEGNNVFMMIEATKK